MNKQQRQNWKDVYGSTSNCQKSYNWSTNADQNSFFLMRPIHSASQSFLSVPKSNRTVPKPAFGTKAARQTKQLQGNKQSDVVAYSRINYQKDEKYHDRYEQCQPKLAPFMSTKARFQSNNARNPGPGNYDLPGIFIKKNPEDKQQGAMYCPFKKWERQENPATRPNQERQREYRLPIQRNQQIQMKNRLQIQRKIKRKRQQIKERQLKLRQMMQRPQKSDFKYFLKKSQMQQKENTDTRRDSPNKRLLSVKRDQNKLDLKHITSSFLPKMEFNFQRQQFRTGSQSKDFRETNNYHPIFLSKNENLFGSYINNKEGPGPGYYEKRTMKVQKGQNHKSVNNFF